eukprot:TRINITY_DN2477_c0_g1_i2.p1 TRINITY_DN2477_c0_g1~~TRINITY_DN2477_c0_g1_i2.p1  ORF type:complete len:186 (-),score=19.18 TRINITY_DN2477_c0_g1_i2:10-567(-)
MQDPFRINLEHFNGIRMEVKTDGKEYKVWINVDTIENDITGYAFISGSFSEWQTLELPIERFLQQRPNPAEDSNFLPDTSIRMYLRHLGFIREAEDSEDFELRIRRIDLIHHPEFDQLSELYERPFFFQASNNHLAARCLNVGGEILRLTDQNDKNQSRKSRKTCLLYTSPSPRDRQKSRMPSSA